MLRDYAKYVAVAGKDGEKAPIELISDFVTREAEIAAEAGIVGLPGISNSRKNSDNCRSLRLNEARVYAVTDIGAQNQREPLKNVKCAHCGYGHRISKCRDFSRETLRNKWKIVKNLNLCFKCLDTSHSRRDCPARVACDRCNRQHHRLLHFVEESNNRNTNSSNKKNASATISDRNPIRPTAQNSK